MAIQTTIGSPPLDGEALRGAPEQSRARYPDSEGFVQRDGQRLFYEVYGEGEETIFLLPTWSLAHSRHWKMQIHYLARHFRVLTMDGLGNGRSDRCRDPRRYDIDEIARDCLAVMDATGTERALMVGFSKGAQYTLELARIAPERVTGAVFIGPLFPYTPSHQSLLFNRLTFRYYFTRSVLAFLSLVGTHERQSTGYRTFPSSSSGSSRAAFRSRTRPRRSRTGSAGRWKPTRRR